MPVRLAQLTLALLIAAAGAIGCGGGAEPAAPGGPPRVGRYVGETSQGLPISFVVTGTAVRELSFGWRASCDDGEVHANTIALGGGGIHYRVFTAGGRLETGGIAHVQGKFDGGQASGELSRRKGSAFGTNCRATGIGWSAEWVSGAPADGLPS